MMAALAEAWLVASSTALGLPLGALAILFMHALTGGRWGEAMRPALGVLALTLPLALLLFAPSLAALHLVLPFLDAPVDTLPQRVVLKLGYLAPGWIVARTLLVAVLWLAMLALAGLVPLRPPLRSKPAAVAGLVLYAIALLVFTTDWMQALEPTFVSTIYPMLVAGAQVLGAFAAATLALHVAGGLAGRRGGGGAPLSGDLARLLLSGVLTWAYLAYMQWLIIWIGDLPDEAAWYVRRDAFPWPLVFWPMLALFCIGPFLVLLLGRVRRDSGAVAGVAAGVLVGYVAEGLWRQGAAFAATAEYLVALVVVHLAVGTVLLLAVRWRLRRAEQREAHHA